MKGESFSKKKKKKSRLLQEVDENGSLEYREVIPGKSDKALGILLRELPMKRIIICAPKFLFSALRRVYPRCCDDILSLKVKNTLPSSPIRKIYVL